MAFGWLLLELDEELNFEDEIPVRRVGCKGLKIQG